VPLQAQALVLLVVLVLRCLLVKLTVRGNRKT
jgi:hypothetical protein